MEIQHTGHQTPSPAKQQDPLTAEQKETLQKILSNYKPEIFSRQDHITMRQDLREAGIPKTMEVGRISLPIGTIKTKLFKIFGESD
jgi:hypothetical protein